MIVNKESKVVGKVKFEKGRLSLAFPKTRVQQLEIQEQLESFKHTGSIEFVNPNYTFSLKKEGETYNVSLTQPVTKTVSINVSDAKKIEYMLNQLSNYCDGTSLSDSHSSTNLLINESPR